MNGHITYVISQPFPASMSPGFQAVCPTCGVLSHDGRQEDAQSVATGHTMSYVKMPRDRGHIKDYVTIPEEPVTPEDIAALRRRQREIEEALSA